MTEVPDRQSPPPIDRDSGELVRALTAALRGADSDRVGALVADTHAADLADVIGLITAEDRRLLIAHLGESFDPEILAHLEDSVRAEVVERLGTANLAAAVSVLETDDAVDVDVAPGSRTRR